MTKHIVRRVHHASGRRNALIIYAAVLMLIFQSYLVSFVNSSYIEQFVSSRSTGAIFTIASSLTVIIFLFISRVLHRVGNYQTTLFLLFLDFISVVGMSFADSFKTAIPLAILHLTVIPLIVFNFDVFLEENIGNKESSTGSKRGLLLSLSSFIGAVTPLVTGSLIGDTYNFSTVYYVSALCVIPMIALVLIFFRNFKDPQYDEIKVFSALRSFWVRPDIRNVFLAHFVLQTFFFFMVVYTPLYLSTEIGLTWSQIGIILFGAQLAYVFFEFPIGKIGDLYIGEKEMMIAGYFILAITSVILAFITSTDVWVWVLAMFATRTGASLAETTTESYFFKHTDSSDAQIISFFRITRPLSYIFGSLIGSFILLYVPFNYIFVFLGLMILPATIAAANIEDTK